MEKPAIYVADLEAYNNGIRHGVWIDATQNIEDMRQALCEMLSNSPLGQGAKEWAIHDCMNFGRIQITRYQGLESARELAVFVEEHGDLAAEVLDIFGGDVEKAIMALEDNYAGEHESLADFARELTEDTSEVPEHLAFYIDYEAMGRDMELNGDVFTIKTGYQQVHIFWNH